MPNYNNSISYAYESADDAINQRYIATADCYVQAISRTGAKEGEPFVRITIDNMTVYEGCGRQKTYYYVWSPLFFVKKGSAVVYTISNGDAATDGKNSLRVYAVKSI